MYAKKRSFLGGAPGPESSTPDVVQPAAGPMSEMAPIVEMPREGITQPEVLGEFAPLPQPPLGRASVVEPIVAGKFWVRGVLVDKSLTGEITITMSASKPGDATSSGGFTTVMETPTGDKVLVVVTRMSQPDEEAATKPDEPVIEQPQVIPDVPTATPQIVEEPSDAV